MSKYLYKNEIEKQAALGAIATGIGKAMASNIGKTVVKGAAKGAASGALIGAASPVQKNPDGTKGSRIKNAIGGAVGGAAVGGVMSGAKSAFPKFNPSKNMFPMQQSSISGSNIGNIIDVTPNMQ